MRLVSTIARYLLGLMFTVFGANGFLHFIPQPPPGNPLALQFMVAVSASHYFAVVFFLQLFCGILLLVNRFVPLALVILAGIILNILDYHVTMEPGTIAPGLLAAVLWVLVYHAYRANFAGIFRSRPETAA